MPRNYDKEYKNYQGKPDQIKRRSNRNKARRKLAKAGRVRLGDGVDVAHKDGNPNNNSTKNLSTQSKAQNRSFKRTKAARKARGAK